MNWFNRFFSNLSRSSDQKKEKTFEEKYNDLGSFEFNDDGFTFR